MEGGAARSNEGTVGLDGRKVGRAGRGAVGGVGAGLVTGPRRDLGMCKQRSQ